MTASLAAKLQQAMSFLRAGRAQEAESLCRQILMSHPRQPDALHMLAMKARGQNQFAEAEKYFRQSLESAPLQPAVLGNYANMLMGLGRLDEAISLYRKAVKVDSSFVNGWYNLSLALTAAGQGAEALTVARRLADLAPTMPVAWELLGTAERQAGSEAKAQDAYREGLRLDPKNARLWNAYGDLLRAAGEFEAAATAFEKARAAGMHVPGLYQNLGECYYEARALEKAQAVHEEAVTRFRYDPDTQYARAKFRWETGAEGDHLSAIRQAISEKPDDPNLWGAYVDLLGHQARFEEVLTELDKARGPCGPAPRLLLAEAVAHSALGHTDEATAGFETILKADAEGVQPRLMFAEHLIKSGAPERADALCAFAIERDPYDQRAWAFRGTAWQLMGDPRTDWLLDYERMVRPVEVLPPADYADAESFFARVKAELEMLHQMQAHPLDQTLRGGTQTNGFLFRLKNPILRALKVQIGEAIERVLDDFPDDSDHPFWGRRTDGFSFKGAWSVRLASQGFHTNHFHPEGWFSSALYVALPAEVQAGKGTEGHIQFGAPPVEMGLDLPPQRIVRPEVGKLALFPSYMWHGTIPFMSDEHRITVAFDFVPS
ncbi:2OG-Fe(II) oxygenase family protein [Kordiimonas marina]|uniref:2OG-Fe(II) oxygenase family protein n=1 Tax=Kordiimonas marina TaxID=2872312 RepID=UPI001FF1E2A1|nr:tetratricopeptide repeat protein [Kordiimonas marina]MCJ9430443.1 tetratricopeptide repeat protein [Kordiimonas marina]